MGEGGGGGGGGRQRALPLRHWDIASLRASSLGGWVRAECARITGGHYFVREAPSELSVI